MRPSIHETPTPRSARPSRRRAIRGHFCRPWCRQAQNPLLHQIQRLRAQRHLLEKGQPSHAEKVLQELGAKNGWEFEFSKDGSKFSKEYLAQFDTVMFYTTGNLLEAGTDGQPPMTAEGKQALFDFVKSGKGFVGTHSASDTFHTNNESKKGPDRYLNHGEQADSYVRFLGGEFIKHGAQQEARNTVENPKFPALKTSAKTTASWKNGIR